ncbi:hypothetical protein H1R20_g6596, partial [Candolleomyces eurysporus]
MDLVVKVRRGGVGTHFCIHKYFYERSSDWQAIREEETQAEEAARKGETAPEVDDEDDANSAALQFTPIDSRHLSSLPLVKARIVKLLKASQNNIHASNNLLLTLGFSNPTKTDRRFFQSRIRELIQQGVIEKVIVPSNRKKSTGSSVKCFRLVNENAEQKDDEEGILVQADDSRDDDIVGDDSGVKANITIHKQIIDLLEESGTSGMTLNELSTALANFDKRTIELFLARAEKSQPPKHLADLGIAGLMETSGRERRHRYFTVAAYQKLVAAEQLDKASAGFGDIDISEAGGFYPLHDAMFFNDINDLQRFQDTFNRVSRPSKRQFKNPILPDGTVKQGRPRKNAAKDGESSNTAKGNKRKRDATDGAEREMEDDEASTARKKTCVDSPELQPQSSSSVAKKRGRPKKVQPTDVAQGDIPEGGEDPSTSRPKKRGRPPKRKAGNVEETEPMNVTKRTRPAEQGDVPTEASIANSLLPSPPDAPPAQVTENQNPLAQAPIHPPLDAQRPNSSHDQTDPTQTAMTTEPPIPRETPAPSAGRTDTTPKGGRGRVNVSHLRRENEILRVLEEAGGIFNIQTKEFYDAHTALLDALAKAGEPTSAPVGTRTDKRTATLTIDGLETKGKVKQLKTSVTTHTGVNKPANIVYLPSVSQEQLNLFLAELARGPQPSIPSSGSAVKIQEPVEYGADPSVSSRGILPLQLLQLEQPGENKKERWSKNTARANQLFAHDDATIRDVLLAERTTLGQLYGFIVGKTARAREFHLSTLEALASDTASPNIIPGSRIVELTYFSHDIPVRLFTAYVSALSHSEQLTSLFATEEGRNTPVKDLPNDLHTQLQVGRSRARSRLLDLFELLLTLKLVTPLKPSTSTQPWIACSPHESHPTAFDVWVDHAWTSSTPHAAPSYWYFNTQAPIYLWGMSESDPPFWKTVSVANSEISREYWQLLKEASMNSHLPTPAGAAKPAEPLDFSVSTARSLRRLVSWKADYVLTWHQARFFEKSIDIASGSTVLEEEDLDTREDKLKRLCWVTSAPRSTVENYLRTAQTRIMNDQDKIRSQVRESKRLKKMEDTKVALARKAEEAKVNREKEWASLLEKVHPGDLGAAASRVERVHLRFMQAGSTKDLGKWEGEVLEALREADLASKKILKVTGKRPIVGRVHPPANASSEVPSTSNISIRSLIEQQQPLLDQGVYKRKPKGKKKAEEPQPAEEKKSVRRHRFQWNKDYDELARDASVIVRARCRSLSRLDWTALEQVFPAVPRNTVRQRLSHMRESPGSESYLRRLEDRWYGLWVKHRGTDALPDEHIESASNFNLIQHIEFLRQNVDKNALRVGFGQEREAVTDIIPRDVESLQRQYQVVEEAPAAPQWDFVWNAVVEEGREKRLLSQCLTTEIEDMPHHNQEADDIALAEAALKMAMGSPPENYNCDRASTLLKSAGEEQVSMATQRLLGKGILSKSQRDPQKQRPGRQLKISDSNQNALGGAIPSDTYQDAAALLESAQGADQAWREWPLTATDGDTVALIHLVSQGQVEFKVDTTDAQAARHTLDWNSKRAVLTTSFAPAELIVADQILADLRGHGKAGISKSKLKQDLVGFEPKWHCEFPRYLQVTMKVPQFWSLQATSAKAKLVWTRIFFSRLTIAYFAFTVAHFVIQIGLQLRTFTINANAVSFLGSVLAEGNATSTWMPILRGSSISMCYWVSSSLDVDVETCSLVWTAEDRNGNSASGFPLDLPVSVSEAATSTSSSTSSTVSQTPTSSVASSSSAISTSTSIVAPSTTTVFVVATSAPESDDDDDDEEDDVDDDDRRRRSYARRALEATRVEENGKFSVVITGGPGPEPVVLDETCLQALNWPLSILRNTKREDIVFIAFQIWVLGMSVVAILNESIPHILASLLTHVMATAWAAFQITHTANFRSSFDRVIANGACSGTSAILPGFWQARSRAEWPTLAMHILALIISCFLTWKMVKLYGWQTFKRVGASLTINRIYKIVLTMSITIQLSLFFMVVTVSLWIDQLMNSSIGDLASFTTLYKVSSFVTLAILVPWLCLGWVGVRRELRLPMFFFLIICSIYLAGWGAMFFSTTFRWTFVTWRFFSVMASASVLLTCASFILGVICRYNFGRGLLRYLGAHQNIEDDSQSSTYYNEKKDVESFAFPANTLVPTFASTYTPGDLPYRVEPNQARGPRFFNQDAPPFEEQFNSITPPSSGSHSQLDGCFTNEAQRQQRKR